MLRVQLQLQMVVRVLQQLQLTELLTLVMEQVLPVQILQRVAEFLLPMQRVQLRLLLHQAAGRLQALPNRLLVD